MRLVEKAQSKPQWKDKAAGGGHGRGPARAPLVLKILAAVRHLGKGHDPETLEEAAQISEAALRTFIGEFKKWLATDLFAELVRLPTEEELRRSLAVYERLGLPGCYGEFDGVHLEWDKWL